MRILLVTPAPAGSLKGNRTTADRWARLLRQLGHRVEVKEEYGGEKCDLLIALHARKSYEAARRYRKLHPAASLVVALTGTDLYRDLRRSARARKSLAWATRLVVLQPLALREIPRRLRRRARVIYQTAPRSAAPPGRSGKTFDVCVASHLRAVKDPFRAALAARLLPAASRLRVLLAGAALTPAMARRAQAEARRNRRFRWLGALPRAGLRRLMARSHLLVISSKLEGGANVVSEAVAASLPIVASRVPGNVGLLGTTYPGYFPYGDTRALARVLHRAESDPSFFRTLERRCAALAPRLSERARERTAWARLLREIAPR